MTEYMVYDLRLRGEVLYVGVSTAPKKRIKGHSRGWGFMKEVEIVVVSKHRRRVDGLKAEAKRIRELAPPLNVEKHPACEPTAPGRRRRKEEVRQIKLQHEAAYWDAVRERNRIFMAEIERDLAMMAK